MNRAYMYEIMDLRDDSLNGSSVCLMLKAEYKIKWKNYLSEKESAKYYSLHVGAQLSCESALDPFKRLEDQK